MAYGFMRLAAIQLETKLQKCIRIGITIFKIFIWGGISSYIRLEITFYGYTRVSPKTKFLTVYPTENFEYGYPLSGSEYALELPPIHYLKYGHATCANY